MRARAVGRWTRLGVGAQVGLALVLALAAVVLSIQAAEWWYVRADLSLAGRNTLDPATEDLIERLPEPVVVDVFFRPLQMPFQQPAGEAQSAMLELLFTARNAHRHELEVRVHDLARLEEVQTRQQELGIEGVNVVTLSCGARTTTLSLFHDLAVIDWGNPTQDGLRYLVENQLGSGIDFERWSPDPRAYRPPRLSEFHGAEAFAEALLKVSVASSPRVYFATGHGEYDVAARETDRLGRLAQALEGDGFEVREWDGAAAVPADCDVLALIGARQPYLPAELQRVREYVELGGRIVVAPRVEEVVQQVEGGLRTLLAQYSILVDRGIVCEEVASRVAPREEHLLLRIGENGLNASHPLTEPLRRRGRTVTFVRSAALGRGEPEGGWTIQALVSSSRDSWLDLPDASGAQDLLFDPARERRGARGLCLISEGPSAVQAPGEELRRARVLGVGAADLFADELFDYNRDFLLNAFNWLAERDYRVGVAPRDPGISLLEIGRGPAARRLGWAVWALPVLCMAIGLFVAVRRRS